MKRIVSIQDISCLGRCSQTVALPVISAEGVECAAIPTALLSTHTSFQGFTRKDLTDQILPIAHHWKQLALHFDGIYTGYLATREQVERVLDFVSLIRAEDTFLFVDPAMADHGILYSGFPADFPSSMATLVAQADITVPNITEACLMTNTPFLESYNENYIHALLKSTAELGAKIVILTGVSYRSDQIGIVAYQRSENRFFEYFNNKEPSSFHGTGDIFSATAVGALVRGLPLDKSLQLAVDFTLECIQATRLDTDSSWYGVHFEKALPILMDYFRNLE